MDLFSTPKKFDRLNIPDAEVFYMQNMGFDIPDDVVMRRLIDETKWKDEEIFLYGKRHKQPRLIAWYGDDDKKNYSYSGIKLNPNPWTELLKEIKLHVEKLCNYEFNSVLLNYYRSEKDSIGFHSDDEKELGNAPVIASVSYGEIRTFIFKSKKNKKIKNISLKLSSGSLLLMKGDTQKNWVHGINKENVKCGPRINLTFRHVEEGE
ncbi:hypothetical protein CBR65_17400 [Cellvibrio sp. PSBB006]|nr:hypothetical protein CBR65_17400 [Cellvibrio sp. PSBB006]